MASTSLTGHLSSFLLVASSGTGTRSSNRISCLEYQRVTTSCPYPRRMAILYRRGLPCEGISADYPWRKVLQVRPHHRDHGRRMQRRRSIRNCRWSDSDSDAEADCLRMMMTFTTETRSQQRDYHQKVQIIVTITPQSSSS